MTQSEYESSQSPCDLAIARAAAQQDAVTREQAEKQWGDKAAKQLFDVFKAVHNVYNFEQNVLANFAGSNYSDTFYAVHCVWAEQENSTSKCGAAALPRWFNAPEVVKSKFMRYADDGPGLEDDLEFQDFCSLSGQCQQ